MYCKVLLIQLCILRIRSAIYQVIFKAVKTDYDIYYRGRNIRLWRSIDVKFYNEKESYKFDTGKFEICTYADDYATRKYDFWYSWSEDKLSKFELETPKPKSSTGSKSTASTSTSSSSATRKKSSSSSTTRKSSASNKRTGRLGTRDVDRQLKTEEINYHILTDRMRSMGVTDVDIMKVLFGDRGNHQQGTEAPDYHILADRMRTNGYTDAVIMEVLFGTREKIA